MTTSGSRVRHSKNYLLGVLVVILAFNSVDRLALGLLLQDIKSDLALSDTQLGFLTGIAFALFYSIMGIPIARLADRGNRVALISITTALWSAAVALCGAAGNFVQLLLIRVGVAVGEAGCIPPAHSLLADYFSRGERPRAVAIYLLGGSLSIVVGYFVAGWLNELYGWRVTFVLLGLPGLALAPLAGFTLREPRLDRKPTLATPAQPGFRETCRLLWGNRTFRHLLLCFAVMSFFGYGLANWQPTFFARSYGLTSGLLGTWFALIYGVGGILGTWLGGEWASRRAAGNESLQLKVMALITASFGVISSFIYLSTSLYVAFALMGLAALAANASNGPLFATIQTLVPDRMRAMSIALLYLFANLVGMGLGPLVAGVLSDAFRSWAGEESLRYALWALCPGYFWGAWHLWRAGKTVAHDLEILQGGRALPV